ncbi:ERF superfamily protein [Olleya phage Harreka_1]|uniref:ERF superfamily protein n=1 Tax=Olleya phage Harreka_1 TaxID=2745673 RepID=A0A8E5EAT4_9CAUD|nr:Erf-like ssDNA annealing protein [Olleya phage Harreka_1]QQV90444.1 ERF superfamily protein [Olleya phage Harreka_1]
MEIYKKLLEIQKKVKGLSKDKESHNFSYVTGNKLLSFIKPLMDEQGLILKTEVLEIENTRQDYTVIAKKWSKDENGKNFATEYEKTKSEILSKVMMRFTWIDSETGEKDENLFGANGQNDWEKGLGSALTYAERYFIMKYFHIATDEDDVDNPERKPIDYSRQIAMLKACKTVEDFNKVWAGFTSTEQAALTKDVTPIYNAIPKK